MHAARREIAESRIAEGLSILEQRAKPIIPIPPPPAPRKHSKRKPTKKSAGNRRAREPGNIRNPACTLADKTRQPGSYLVSPKPYRHFELRTEWKITEPGGSGGVFFRFAAPGRDDPYRKAFKVQLADDKDFKPDPQTTGALHTYEAPSENRSKARGEWNTLRLRVQNLKVEVWINGKQVLDTIAQNDMVPVEGYVALDGISGGIAYRKTLLVELAPTVE